MGAQGIIVKSSQNIARPPITVSSIVLQMSTSNTHVMLKNFSSSYFIARFLEFSFYVDPGWNLTPLSFAPAWVHLSILWMQKKSFDHQWKGHALGQVNFAQGWNCLKPTSLSWLQDAFFDRNLQIHLSFILFVNRILPLKDSTTSWAITKRLYLPGRHPNKSWSLWKVVRDREPLLL